MQDVVRRVGDPERRARLARRHAVAPAHRVGDPVSATEAMTVLHATEPATVHLSAHARIEGLAVADVDRALYLDKTLVKQLAMRRTLFVFPRELLPAVWGSASARVAATERARIAKDIVAGGVSEDGAGWVDRARSEVLAALDGEPDGLQAAELRQRVPHVDLKLEGWPGSIAPRVLTQLGADAQLVRAVNTGHWRTSRPRWTLARHWLGEVPAPWAAEEGYAELVRRWLATFGPGTETDLVWWLGATKGIVRTALATLGAVAVELEASDERGWLLPEDLDPVASVEPWAALLPTLDPTVMGWKQRDFFLGSHGPALFDRNGNAGTTAWWDGRVVGCWVQDPDGVVEVRLLQDVPPAGRAALDAEAERLTGWLDGLRIGTVYPSPAMRA